MNHSIYVKAMKVFTVIYAGGAAAFFFFHNIVAGLLQFDPTATPFWVVLATSMMAMLSYLSWQSSKHPSVRAFYTCHMISKSVSVIGFLYYYLMTDFNIAFLIGAITDSAVIVIVTLLARKNAVSVSSNA